MRMGFCLWSERADDQRCVCGTTRQWEGFFLDWLDLFSHHGLDCFEAKQMYGIFFGGGGAEMVLGLLGARGKIMRSGKI